MFLQSLFVLGGTGFNDLATTFRFVSVLFGFIELRKNLRISNKILTRIARRHVKHVWFGNIFFDPFGTKNFSGQLFQAVTLDGQNGLTWYSWPMDPGLYNTAINFYTSYLLIYLE